MRWNIWTCRGQTWNGAYTRVQGWWKRSSGLDTSNQRTWRSSGCRNCIPELVYLWNFTGNFCSVCIWMVTPGCHSLPQWAKSRTGLRLSKFEPHTRHPNFQRIENHWTILVSLATASDLEVTASSRCSLCKLGFSRFQDSIMSMSRSGFMQDSQKTWVIWVLDNYSRTKPFMDVG